MGETKQKSIKVDVPTFSVDSEDGFASWWAYLRAYAAQKDFIEVLKEDRHKDMPDKEEEDEGNKHSEANKEAILKNRLAVSAMQIAFAKGEMINCLAMVHASVTKEWPIGQAHIIIQDLFAEYRGDPATALFDQRREMAQLTMKNKENPRDFFARLAKIELKYADRTQGITDEEKLVLIYTKAPDLYQQTLIRKREEALKEHNGAPKVREIKQAMITLWKALNERNKNKGQVEYSLTSNEYDYDGNKIDHKTSGDHGHGQKKCYNCGKPGHIKRDCPKLKKCSHCGKKGHAEPNCWDKYPEKKPKRVKGKQTNEIAALSIGSELALARIDQCVPCREHHGVVVGDIVSEVTELTEPGEMSWRRNKANRSRNKAKKRKGKKAVQNVQTMYGNGNRASGPKRSKRGRKHTIKPSQRQKAHTNSACKHCPRPKHTKNDCHMNRQERKKQNKCCVTTKHTRKTCGINTQARKKQTKMNRKGWYRAPAHTYNRPILGEVQAVTELLDSNGQLKGWSMRLKAVPAGTDSDMLISMPQYIHAAEQLESHTRRTYAIRHWTDRLEQDAPNDWPTEAQRTYRPGNDEFAGCEEYAMLNTQGDIKALTANSASESLYSPYIWIADTGATCHITNSRVGSIPSKNANARLKTANHSMDASGNKMQAVAIVDIPGIVRGPKGTTTLIRMMDCRYGGSKFNLCSITKLTDNGWTMTGDKSGIHLYKGKQTLHFDIPIHSKEGKLWAVRIDRRNDDRQKEMALVTKPTTITVQQAHEQCGHANMRSTKETAKHLGWMLEGKDATCEACAIGKAKQVDLGSGETQQISKIGQKWYVDGLSLKEPKTGGVVFPYNNCLTVGVEYLTGGTILGWYRMKKGFVEDFCTKLHRFKRHGKRPEYIRCDDGGENYKFEAVLNGKEWRMDAQFEYTAKTPQRNSRVETKLYHLCGKTRAALAAANVPDRYRYTLFTHFLKWAAQTDMLTVVDVHGKKMTRHEHLYGELPKWINNIQVAGMAGVVKTHKRGTAKVKARGKVCLFVHYSENHARDCYVMYDPKTKKTIHSRDVRWLGRMYYKTDSLPGIAIEIETGMDEESVASDASESSEESTEHTSIHTEVVDFEAEQPLFGSETESTDGSKTIDSSEADTRVIRAVTRSGRHVRAPLAHDGTELAALAIQDGYAAETCLLGLDEAGISALDEVYDESMMEEEALVFALTKGEKVYQSVEHAFGYIDSTKQHRLVAAALADTEGELFLVGATGENYGNTEELNVMNYQQAMKTVDREEWEKAIKVEHDKMVKYNVFEVVHPRDIPKGTKLFDSTWAMKKKPNGVFRARNAFRGFQQVDGKHYDSHDKSAQLATEVSIRICFVLTLAAKWYQHLVDVEGAFLNGEFQHPDRHQIYMKIPEAYKKWYPAWGVFKLLKTQYGTVQAALQYYRECCKALAFMGFKRNPAEPCVFYKYEKEQLVLFVLWVDDCCISGPKELVLRTVEQFMGLWDCKDLGQLKEYVGCQVEREAGYIRLTQPVKVQRFVDEFGCAGGTGTQNKAPTTPAEPGSVLEYEPEIDKPLSPEEQTKYRSGVGILLHMMRWSRPDVLNAVRELSSHMQQASARSMKALKRVMNFIVSTKKKGFTIKVTKPGGWNGRRGKYKFTISGKCDSEYAKHSSRRSVNAGIVYLEGAIVKQFSKMMPIIALSTTEAELYSAVLTAQDMMFVYHIMINMELEIELPMILYCDNKGTVDLANNWSVGGRTRHIDVKQNFLRELKERGFLMVKWRTGNDMTPDMHTKNLSRDLFNQYSSELVS